MAILFAIKIMTMTQPIQLQALANGSFSYDMLPVAPGNEYSISSQAHVGVSRSHDKALRLDALLRAWPSN